MYCFLGTTKECESLYGQLPQMVLGELIRGLAVIECEYGLERDIFETGGYSVVADTEDDLDRVRRIFDDRQHKCEWSTKLSDSGFCSALYLLSNEFSVMLYIPIALANNDILENMED